MNDDSSDDTTFSPGDRALERAVSAYEVERQRGAPPNLEAFIARYPDIAERLRACLSGLAAADAAAETLATKLTRIPQRLGEFEIIGELGRGGMGEVYRATQVSLNRPVALKVLPPNWTWTPNARKRFHREARAAGRLHHTNIVAVYAEGEEQGVCYYAMELIDGPSLADVVRELRTSKHKSRVGNDRPETPSANSSLLAPSSRERFDIIANWIASLADALGYAHQQGVIHRDVKPSNIMVSSDGRVRLNDFGLAQLSTEPGITVTGELLGTPRYMSPEQVSPTGRTVDQRTDIYSLGATLYELLTTQPPFPGESRDQIITQLLSQEPKRPRQIDRAIPVDLETVCLKALEKNPSLRYQSANELAEDLRRYVNRYSISAKRTRPARRIVKWALRRPAIAILSASLLTMFFAVGLLAWQNSHNSARVSIEKRNRAMDQAMAAALGGNTEEAEEAINQAELLGLEPGRVRMVQGQIALARGDTKRAFEHLEQAVNLMPDSVAAHAFFGRLQVYTGSYQFGWSTHEKLQTLKPKSNDDFLYLGYFYGLYAPKEALDTLDKVIAKRDSSVARLIRADALNNAVQLGDASLIDKAVNDAEVAYAMLANNQLALAKCIEAHTVAANAFQLAGDETKRQHHLDRGKELVAKVPEVANDQLLFHAASFWDRAEQWDLALDAWRRAAASGWVRSVKHCIVELYRQEMYAEALTLCERSHQQSKGTNVIPLRLLIYAELDDSEAVEREVRGMTEDPDSYKLLVAQVVLGNERTDAITNSTPPSGDGFGRVLYDINHGKRNESVLAELTDAQRPEAQFHLAHRLLGDGKPAQALEHLRAAEAPGMYYFYEYRWARAFRERIEKDPKWPMSIRVRR